MLDAPAATYQVHEDISQHLSRPMIGHVTATVAMYKRDVMGISVFPAPAPQAAGIDGRMLQQPDLIGGKFVASRAKRLHGVQRSFVVEVPEIFYYDVGVLIHGYAQRPQTKVL